MTISHSSATATGAFSIDSALDAIAHWLPTQGPLKDFIHHNTLHAVDHYPFHKGVAVAAKTFGARSYLPLTDYQKLYQQGRIKNFAIDWALAHTACGERDKHTLRERLFTADDSAHYPPVSLANHGIRTHWLTQLEIDLNSLVHPIIFRLLSNFLDQGISHWTLPKADETFWQCIQRLTQNSLLPLYPFDAVGVRDLLNQPLDTVIHDCLAKIVGNEALYEQYLLEMLLAHPGWSGMVRLIERTPTALLEARLISLKELVAVELIAELALIQSQRAARFLQVAQIANLHAIPLLSDYQQSVAVSLRLQIWQEAMEFSLHAELLTALQHQPLINIPAVPLAQAIFCIDDRECSVRRYLESHQPAIETFGAAGFFGIDFLYQGFDDAYPVAQCPNNLQPKHLIHESNLATDGDTKPSLADNFSALHIKPHSLLHGWLFTQLLGIGYAARMVWDVFRPGSQLLNVQKLSEINAHTHLHLLREQDEPNENGQLLGFSLTEMADKIESLLRAIGLTQHFAPLVVIVAHGSSSNNNPHFAAYDCGACAGKPGAPNARAFAWMANHEEVRALLRERGIFIPDNSYFVPALHNTSRDEITYLDEHLYAERHLDTLPAFQHTMRDALASNASERCRWFELAPRNASVIQAHDHVQLRASSIFEPRPELNHSNNLYSIVGRRALTRNLFLDRRAFLHSYAPHSDNDGAILARILSAVIPVCGGINLEYLFSRMDNDVYGAGTKLPHNVIGLLGVANGVEGDLRTGLPAQMIEVHEPARLLIVVEQTTDVVDRTLAKLGVLCDWLNNEWVRLVACHPESRELFYYFATGWEAIQLPEDYLPPSANNSEDIIAHQHSTIPVHILRRNA
jgi:uncharacterized protein YbcC (UPF0753/DUF2309 family)